MNYPEIRHQLHSLAEASGHEDKTAKAILYWLNDFTPTEIHTFPDSHNIMAIYDSGVEGPTLLLRGDMDAVGVDEHLSLPYGSKTPGYAHKCGHDGHTTILLGVAEQLHLHPLPKGKILLFFQAAEETGQGCAQLINSGFLSSYHINMVFALHNIPGIPLHNITCRAGSFTCAVISCEIKLTGKTSHAAEPEKGISPFRSATSISEQLLELNHPQLKDDNYQIVTLVESHIGETAYGVSAGHGVLRFTLRAKSEELLQALKQETEHIVATEVAKTPGLTHEIRWLEYFAGGHNSADAVELVKQAAHDNGLTYIEKEVPFTWGEDFGLLTQHYPGALFGLGSGTHTPPLHHQDFDFPDEIIATGVKMMTSISKVLIC
jgi:amidohydrolase